MSSIVPYRKRGPKYLDTLQFERALADYTRCEQADGMSIESRYRIGMAHYLMRKYDDAIRAFADSLAIAPQDDDMYILRMSTGWCFRSFVLKKRMRHKKR